MKLSVAQRLRCLELLPNEGSYLTLRVVNEAKQMLGISAQEFKDFEIKQDGNVVQWNAAGQEGKDIPLTDPATDIIKAALTKLDKDNKLTMEQMSLYELFVKES